MGRGSGELFRDYDTHSQGASTGLGGEVSGVENYSSGTPTLKVVYLKPSYCVCKSGIVERFYKNIYKFHQRL